MYFIAHNMNNPLYLQGYIYIIYITTKFWKPIHQLEANQAPQMGLFFAPVNSTGRGVPPPLSTGRLQLLCQCSFHAHERTDPTTQKLIGNTCTCRYASTSATGWHVGIMLHMLARQRLGAGEWLAERGFIKHCWEGPGSGRLATGTTSSKT